VTMKDSKPKYRIVYRKTICYGMQYEIQERVPFLFFFERWTGTHLCNSLREAKMIVQYLKELPGEGDVVYVS